MKNVTLVYTSEIEERDLGGFKYFKLLSGLLESLHESGCQRDRAHNRILHMGQYMTLLLMYMFNPVCDSPRALQEVGKLRKLQRVLKVPRSSLGSLSEAARVFDSELMIGIIGRRCGPRCGCPSFSGLRPSNDQAALSVSL